MERVISDYIGMCQWDTASFLIFSNNVFGTLIYYSHLLPLVASLLIALFIFFKNPKLLAARWFFVTVALLSVWLFFDLILWANEKPPLIMFFWSLLVLIEPIIYAGVLLFVYAIVDGKGTSFRKKLIIFALLLPTVILASTDLALTTYDLTNCEREAIEGPLAFYGYVVEMIFALWILGFGLRRFFQYKNTSEKKKVALITAGAVFFLLSFSLGNVVGSLSLDWEIGQYGLFGIPVFVAVLSYLVVKYNAFDVKLISTQILVTALWILTLGILFLRQISTVRIVVSVTLICFSILGYLLIKSVKREIEQREQIERLALDLQTANKGQETLIHIMNHQIKGYLGRARIIFHELLSGSYGVMPEKAQPPLAKGLETAADGVAYVQSILRGASAAQGTLPYDMQPIDLALIVAELVAEQQDAAKEQGLLLTADIEGGDYRLTGDAVELKEAFKNLVTNAIKYNVPKGSIAVALRRTDGRMVFSVKDTGRGIPEEDRSRIFTTGGMGADSLKYNPDAAGFGLAFVKGVVEHHHGRVWYESNAPEQGMTFFVEVWGMMEEKKQNAV